jgi:hypothetical protein
MTNWVVVLAFDDDVVVVGIELLAASPPGSLPILVLQILLTVIGDLFNIGCQVRGCRVNGVAILQSPRLEQRVN